MPPSDPRFEEHSGGERGIYLAYVFVGIFGAISSFVVVNDLGGEHGILRALGLYDIWAIISGAIGAPSGLYVGRKWLGKKGLKGFFSACCAIPVVSFIGSLIGGTIALPIYGTMFGPLALAGTFYENPIMLIMWSWTIFFAHLLFAEYRKERDTIFRQYRPANEVVRLPT